MSLGCAGKQFGYGNVMQIPTVTKVVVNMGCRRGPRRQVDQRGGQRFGANHRAGPAASPRAVQRRGGMPSESALRGD